MPFTNFQIRYARRGPENRGPWDEKECFRYPLSPDYGYELHWLPNHDLQLPWLPLLRRVSAISET